MAIKQAFAIKTVLGDTDFTLEADPGEAFRIWDIFIDNPASDYVTLKIEKTTIGYFRVSTGLGSHLMFPKGRTDHIHSLRLDASVAAPTKFAAICDASGQPINMFVGLSPDVPANHEIKGYGQMELGLHAPETILSYLRKKGVFAGYPIAEGETLLITGAKQADAVQMVIYEIWDPEDISPDQENGSKSKEYFFINYGVTDVDILTSGDFLINTPVNPAEFPAFPYGKDVPAKHEITLMGILASDYAPRLNQEAMWIRTKFLKLIKDREVLYDEDRNGLLMLGTKNEARGAMSQTAMGVSICGNYGEKDAREPFWFPEPMICLPGDELLPYWTVEANTPYESIDTNMQCIGLIEKVKRIE